MQGDTVIDPGAVLAALGWSAPRRVEPVLGGAATAIWRVEGAGCVAALRVFRPSQAVGFAVELEAMERARSGGVPVPEVYATTSWQEHPAMLLAWCPGSTLGALLRRQPWSAYRWGIQFGRMQAAIHAVPLPPQADDPDGWIGAVGPDEEPLQRRLRGLERRSALLHLDYHLLNVLGADGRITGVIDWANARTGDPRADVARTYALLRIEPYTPRSDSLALGLVRRLFTLGWQRGYQRAGGTVGDGRDMALFYAWAGIGMARNLAPRVARPDSWWEQRHIDAIRRWAEGWKQRAGLTE